MDFADGVYDCRVPANDAARAVGVNTEDPNDDWYYQKAAARLQDAARLYSIRDAARAACSSVSVDESVSGDITRNNDFNQGLNGDNTQRGYFHVTLCSTRSPFVFDKDGAYTITQASGRVNPCVKDPDLVRNTGDESFVDDSGAPSDRVAIAITFNHPLITPIRGVADNAGNYIPLHSTREMVIERFRTARVVGLPPSFDIPDPPTATPVPPAPPNVEIVYPAEGDPCADVEVVLQARACDPDNTGGTCDVTVDNGTGIANVRLWLQDPWGRNVSDFTDSSPEYCGQGGDSDPCLALDFASGQWPNGQIIIPGMYTLYAIATDDDSEQTTTSFEFEVCIPLDCTVYSMDNFRYTNTSYAVFEVDVHNTGADSPEVAGVRVNWPKDTCLESNWRIDWIEWSNQNIWDSGVDDYTPPTDAMLGGSDRASFVEGRSLPATSDKRLEVDLDGSDQWKCALRYPGGPYFNFEVMLDNGCLISYSPDLVPTPTPDCDGLAAGEISYLDSPDWVGVVVSNTSTIQDFDLVGFDFGWPIGAATAFPGLRADAVKFSDTPWNTDWSGETVWDGDDRTGPTVGCHPCYEDVCAGLDPSWRGTRLGELPQGDVDTWMTEYDANSGSYPNLQGNFFPGEYSLTMYFANLWGGICPVEAIQPDVPSGCDTFTSTLLYPTGDNLRAPVSNVGSDEFRLNDIHLTWPIPDATPVPGMYVNYTRWLEDDDRFWNGDDDTSPTDINLSPPYRVTSPWGQTFEADYNKPGHWNPGRLARDLYLHGRQFHLTFDYETLSGTPCAPLEVDGKYGPVIQVVDPPRHGGGYEVHPDYGPINTESTHAAGACIAGEFSIQAIVY
ncbi:MAG: hypothetical protein U9R15_12300, partial [Chloroflexota bacterium]|nr:hypothetical protein [Chloroflexota bacterium]